MQRVRAIEARSDGALQYRCPVVLLEPVAFARARSFNRRRGGHIAPPDRRKPWFQGWAWSSAQSTASE